ncbi:Laminin subunit alpha-3 [Liparis tanakae]|uniref:Laminin subunit alpha-3 n=1 Tax=Liparis tanakae TaxID=230148 RepID=A0A4Z2E2L6_9TELE|nr:Laminin subunit alpha-3 [Liparis tanakae]
MRWNICLSWCFLLCSGFGFGSPAPVQQKTKRFCDPAFANQTAGAVTWSCRLGTAGPRCERCTEGYYGNAADGTCRACPCPGTQNNFALACLDVGSGVVECLCRRGYSGAACERCVCVTEHR